MVPQPNLDPKEIKRGVEDTSGYPFELQIAQRVERWEEYGYFVEPNYSFEDHDTGQARELDFHGIRALPISTQKSEYAFIIILGSCKANRNPYVFFTRPALLAGMTLMSDVPISGCPLEIYGENGETEAIEWHFRLHRFFHIAKLDIISSQACVLAWKSSKWEVQPEAIIRDTFVPLIKAMSREIEHHNNQCIPEADKILPEYNIYYPVLVLKGPMFEYYVPTKGSAQVRDAKRILLIRHYESKTIKCRYAIDVIHESYLEQYLNLVEKEAKRFVNLIRHYKKNIVRSIEELSTIEKAKSQKDKREET